MAYLSRKIVQPESVSMVTELKKTNSLRKQKIVFIDSSELSPSAVQPRTKFDDVKLMELAESIMVHGILQPLIVRKNPKDSSKYEIIAGERRYRASLRTTVKQLPCIVMDLVTEQALAIALVENIQRQDLNPIEEALAYQRLREALKLNQEEIAQKVGKDRATVANTMRLLRLPKVVQDLVASDSLSMGHARALLALDSSDLALMLAKKICREGLSVRKTEALIRALKSGYQSQEIKNLLQAERTVNPLQKEIQQKLEYVLGTKVHLKKEHNGYAMIIHFSDVEQLNGLLESLGVEI